MLLGHNFSMKIAGEPKPVECRDFYSLNPIPMTDPTHKSAKHPVRQMPLDLIPCSLNPLWASSVLQVCSLI
jgi:hypothetical protein